MTHIFYISQNNGKNNFAFKVTNDNIANFKKQLEKVINISSTDTNIVGLEFHGIEIFHAPNIRDLKLLLQEDYNIELDFEDLSSCINIIFPAEEDVILNSVVTNATILVHSLGALRIIGLSESTCNIYTSDYFSLDDFKKNVIDLTDLLK